MTIPPPEPFFSLVTVARNNLAGVKKTLRSIDAQTEQAFEWIVIDGASSDGTADFLEDLMKKDRPDFPCTFLSEPDRGIYDAMNKGIDRARGDYVLFLNAGDALAGLDILETIRGAAGENRFDMIYGDALEERETPGVPPAFKPARSHLGIARGLFTHHQAIFYHSEALKNLRYNLSYRVASDYDLTARVLARGGSALYVPVPVCIFESGGLSQRSVRLGRAEQFRSRAALGLVSMPVNCMIYGIQTAASMLRSCAPGLYWALRSSRAMAR